MSSSLHGHSDNSNLRLLDCISKPSQILDRAHELGLNGVAITDHESLSSFVNAEQYLEAKRKEDESWNNLKFIRGNEIYLCRNGLNAETYQKGEDRYYHFILLARDYEGYLQLCKLSSRAWGRAYQQYQMRVPTYYQDLIDVIGENRGHIVASTACIGGYLGSTYLKSLYGSLSYEDAMGYAIGWIERMGEILGKENLWLELQPGISKEQIYCNKALIDLSKATGFDCIITTDHHYTRREDRPIHRAYLKSKQGDREVDEFYEATYMMDDDEIHRRMDDQIGAENVSRFLNNTDKIAESIEEFSLQKPLHIPYLPKKQFDIPLSALTQYNEARAVLTSIEKYVESDEAADRQFAVRILRFMSGTDENDSVPRYSHSEKVERMNMELDIIWDSGKKQNVEWSKYFLQVADYIQIFWTLGDSIVAPSRGSAGASYVCHALGINQIDPTREKAPLIFQRFMNPDRASILDYQYSPVMLESIA